MQFIDLAVQQQKIRGRIEQRIQKVLDHGKYIMGPEIEAIEKQLSDFCGTAHAVSCGSGTDALLMALMGIGVGPGDAVFTTPFTFIATAEVISLLGATPVFVDIEPQTFNMDTERLALAIEAVKTKDSTLHPLPHITDQGPLVPKCIIAVDLFGLPANYDRINSIAQKNAITVIEDAAQSFGASFHGKRACSLATIGCTSFFPAKPLGCYGDGGMCFTNDEELAGRLRSIRVHGQGGHKYDNVRIGINGRMDTIQAAILLEKFSLFEEEIELRNQAAQRYGELISAAQCDVIVPRVPEGCTSVWAQYSILATDRQSREGHQDRLKQAGIPTAIYYPKPLHLQEAFAPLKYKKGNFPVSEDCAYRIFSLPMHPYLNSADQARIAGLLAGGR